MVTVPSPTQYDLESMLPSLLPGAISWVQAQSELILTNGIPLDEQGLRIAEAVGVMEAEKVRVSVTPQLPLPDDSTLRNVALDTGLLGPGMIGITFGYGIYLREGHVTNRLLSHECRHVFQYEQAGSIEAFLPVYLQQIVDFGYDDAPFEIDAREHEIDDALTFRPQV